MVVIGECLLTDDGLIEVLDGSIVVLHVHVDEATGFKYQAVPPDVVEYLREAIECVLEVLVLVLHEPQVVDGGHMVWCYL